MAGSAGTLVAGTRWARKIEDALNACPRMMVILSPSSVNSTNVEDEVSFALEERKTVIPVLYRECKIPFRLQAAFSMSISGATIRAG